jgi:hypothetical protein
MAVNDPRWRAKQTVYCALGNCRRFTPKTSTQSSAALSFGEHPIGFIAFAAKRFFALITADERKAPRSAQAVAYPTIIAYTGKWHLDGNRFVTTVDAASTPGWVGTEQVRIGERTAISCRQRAPRRQSPPPVGQTGW